MPDEALYRPDAIHSRKVDTTVQDQDQTTRPLDLDEARRLRTKDETLLDVAKDIREVLYEIRDGLIVKDGVDERPESISLIRLLLDKLH